MAFLCDPRFIHLCRTSTFDRWTNKQTDRQTHNDSIYRATIALHGKKTIWAFCDAKQIKKKTCRMSTVIIWKHNHKYKRTDQNNYTYMPTYITFEVLEISDCKVSIFFNTIRN